MWHFLILNFFSISYHVILYEKHPINQANYYGVLPHRDEVSVLDFTREAFAIFIDILYGKIDRYRLDDLGITKLYEVNRLEDMYQVHRREVLEALAKRRVTTADVMEMKHLDVSGSFVSYAEALLVGMDRILEETRARRTRVEASYKKWSVAKIRCELQVIS